MLGAQNTAFNAEIIASHKRANTDFVPIVVVVNTSIAIAASYDRDLGPWTVSFRYSAGYLRYLDDNYSASGSGGGS